MGKITRNYIQRNPEVLFVFGDNDQRWGKGGMAAEFRDEPNALGVRTKKYPGTQDKHYYTDDEYEDNCGKIEEDIDRIREVFRSYALIVVPEGIGKGRAELRKRAPETYEFLMDQLRNLRKLQK